VEEQEAQRKLSDPAYLSSRRRPTATATTGPTQGRRQEGCGRLSWRPLWGSNKHHRALRMRLASVDRATE